MGKCKGGREMGKWGNAREMGKCKGDREIGR
jgi:hypothetical protein